MSYHTQTYTMTRIQSIITALLGATLIIIGVEGDGYLNQAMLVAAGVNLCAAFTFTGE
jgi:hypothetical protein